MRDNCPECGNTISKKISNYHYKESGLDNVYLQNIPVYECSCGISYPSIFRLPRLNELIARTLLKKPTLLRGPEIRFLRKNIYLSSKVFSRALGIGKTTLSKWENDIQQHSENNDRLIRTTYSILKGTTGKEAQKLFGYLAKIPLKKSDIDSLIIAEKIEDDYVVTWKLIVESQAEDFVRIWMPSHEWYHAIAHSKLSVVNRSGTESDLMISSGKVLKTESNQKYIPPLI